MGWLALSRSDRHVVPLLLLRRANGLCCVVLTVHTLDDNMLVGAKKKLRNSQKQNWENALLLRKTDREKKGKRLAGKYCCTTAVEGFYPNRQKKNSRIDPG